MFPKDMVGQKERDGATLELHRKKLQKAKLCTGLKTASSVSLQLLRGFLTRI